MNYLDIYYRALRDYRKNTLQNRECESQRSATVKANAKADIITVTKRTCQIETDWIQAIEQGLEHVDKAIREDRQFIRSNGEVVDIEKVKNVSTDSVKHLAEHSNLITRFEEGKDIVPDRLYIVERLNDYAVYENRFLYMMLCYLRDFITLRYHAIMEIEHTYRASMAMSKKVEMPKRQISLDIQLQEVKQDDPYLAQRSTSKNIIARIRNILELVHAFLGTPLMEEVSKVAMIKPPITKTNVLRMNHNFRGALALYEYVAAYNKDGYTVTEETQKIQPFRIDMADEFSEIVLLSSFLTYEYGMNVRSDLHENWEQEEQRREKEKQQRLQERIKALRRRIQEEGISPEEYMVMLEQRNRRLEADSEQLGVALQKIGELEAIVEQQKQDICAKDEMIAELKATIERLHEQYQREIAALHASYQELVTEIHVDYREQIEELHAAYQQQIAEIHAAYQELVQGIHFDYRDQIADLHAAYKKQIEELHAAYQKQIEDLHADYKKQIADLHADYQKQIEDLHASYQKQIEDLHEDYQSQIQRLHNEYQTQISEMRTAYETQISELNRSYQAQLSEMQTSYETKIQNLETSYQKQIAEMRDSYESKISALNLSYQTQISKMQTSYETKIQDLETSYRKQITDLRDSYESKISKLETSYQTQIAQMRDSYESKISKMELSYQTQITQMRTGYETKIGDLTTSYQSQIEHMDDAHKKEVDKLNSSYTHIIDEKDNAYREKTTALRNSLRKEQEEHTADVQMLKRKHKNTVDQMTLDYTEQLRRLDEEWKLKNGAEEKRSKERQTQILQMAKQNKALEDARRLSDARLLAIREENGMQGALLDIPKTREEFEELEHQYAVFKAMFKKEWKKAKRQLRASALSSLKQAIQEDVERQQLKKRSAEEKEKNKNANAAGLAATQETAEKTPLSKPSDEKQNATNVAEAVASQDMAQTTPEDSAASTTTEEKKDE